MPRYVTRKYSIGTAKDDKLCGTCGRDYYLRCRCRCVLFNAALEKTPRGARLRCADCLRAEVKE